MAIVGRTDQLASGDARPEGVKGINTSNPVDTTHKYTGQADDDRYLTLEQSMRGTDGGHVLKSSILVGAKNGVAEW